MFTSAFSTHATMAAAAAAAAFTYYILGSLQFPWPLGNALNTSGVNTFDDLQEFWQLEVNDLIISIWEPGIVPNPNMAAPGAPAII